MSKDAQLLRAMGMGPDERLDLWWKAGTPQAHVRDSLGLDLAPSEWTVEHDAAFARVVWPWLREQSGDTKRFIQGSLAGVRLPIAYFSDTTSWEIAEEFIDNWIFEFPNPGPTMCQAIYSVLCGEDGK